METKSLWYKVLVARYDEVGGSVVDGGRGGLVWWNNLNNIRGGGWFGSWSLV